MLSRSFALITLACFALPAAGQELTPNQQLLEASTDPQKVKAAFENGADPNAFVFASQVPPVDHNRDHTIFSKVARLGGTSEDLYPEKEETLRLYLKNGADVTVGFPLYGAIASRQPRVVEFMLTEAECPVDQRGDRNKCVWDAAFAVWEPERTERKLMGEKNQIISLLLKHGADANMRMGDLANPLHHAVYQGNLEAVNELVEGGADPKATREPTDRNPYEYKPLHNAALVDSEEHAKVAARLLELGVDPGYKDALGRTAYAMAVQKGHTTVAKAIKDAGGTAE